MEESVQPASRGELPRREAMQTPTEVAAMLRLKALGWGVRRIAGELGCSHMTVRRYLSEGGWVAYRGRGAARGSLLCTTWTSCPDRASEQHHLTRASSSQCRKGSGSESRLTHAGRSESS